MARQDRRSVILFEELKKGHKALVRWYLIRGHRLLFRRISEGARQDQWLSRLISQRRIAGVVLEPDLVRWQEHSGRQTFEVVERAFPRLSDHPIVAAVTALYEDADIGLAFKKALVLSAADALHFRLLVEQISQTLDSGESVVAVPASINTVVASAIHQALEAKSEHRGLTAAPPLRFPWWLSAAARAWRFAKRLRLAQRWATTAIRSGACVVKEAPREPRRRFRFAVGIVSPMRELANDVRSAGFLLDDQRITSQNTLFIEPSRLNQRHRDFLTKTGWSVARPARRPSRRAAKRELTCLLRLAPHLPFGPDWLAGPALQLARTHAEWTTFLERHAVDHFVIHASFEYAHVGRNLLMRKAGVKTWYFTDSANSGQVWRQSEPYLNPLWGYLTYDCMFVWNDDLRRYLAAHPQAVGRFEVGGCLWAQHVREQRESGGARELKRLLTSMAPGKEPRIIGVFDSWFHPEARMKCSHLLRFIADVETLLDRIGEVVVVFKRKKTRGVVGPGRWPGAERVFEAMDRLAKHPRCLVLETDFPTSRVVAASDLVISFPFTSVTYEALCAGVRAIYHDAAGDVAESIYEGVPGLVTHGTKDLLRRVHELLFEIGDDAYQSFLERYVRGRLDPSGDTYAIDRFRSLLCLDLELPFAQDQAGISKALGAPMAPPATPPGGDVVDDQTVAATR